MDGSQLAECLLSMHETWIQSPALHEVSRKIKTAELSLTLQWVEMHAHLESMSSVSKTQMLDLCIYVYVCMYKYIKSLTAQVCTSIL